MYADLCTVYMRVSALVKNLVKILPQHLGNFQTLAPKSCIPDHLSTPQNRRILHRILHIGS